MRVLVVGSGGREHALVRTLLRSPQRPEVLCAPGNAGIRREARPLDVPGDDPATLARAARAAGVDLVVVGPEAPLVAGLADALAVEGVRCFGPRAAVARLEGSKAFAKEVMAAAGVPTGRPRHRDDGGGRPRRRPRLSRRAQGRRPGRRQGRRHRAGRGRGARRARTRCSSSGASAHTRSWSRSSSRGTSCPCSRCATAAARFRSRRRATTSASATGTAARTRAAWAPSRPSRTPTGCSRDVLATVHQPVVDELARRGTPFHGVLYAGLMLGPEGHKRARVQRPLRRPGDPGGAAAAALGPARAAARGDGAGRPGRRRAGVGRAHGGVRRAGLARLSRAARPPATRSPGSTRCRPAWRSSTRARRSATARWSPPAGVCSA